jgi:hypothetical protein
MRIRLEVLVDVSDLNEATESPWWAIVNPSQNMRADLAVAAGQITGPFFDRIEAEQYFQRRRYEYGKNAHVWCFSGYWSDEYKRAIRAAIAKQKLPAHWESARGEDHGLNSQPGDIWVEDGKIFATIKLIDEAKARQSGIERPECEEASTMSRETFIPCGAPATRFILSERGKKVYAMCPPCASHNVRNRGAEDVGEAKR